MNRYRVHTAIMRPLHFVVRLVEFVDIFLWDWAHYTNPANATRYPGVGFPFKRASLRNMWEGSRGER